MKKRALTLLEVLIALVLLLALGALVVPSMLDSLDERAFESSADMTTEQLMMARAHAQTTGAPVEVTYHAATSEVQARVFSASGKATAGEPGVGSRGNNKDLMAGSPFGVGRLPSVDATDDGSPRPADTLIGESWACRSLSHGVRILNHRPSTARDDEGSMTSTSSGQMLSAAAQADDDVQTIADLAGGQDVRLAVFMPDGSALMGDPVWINDEKGRCGMLTINPWSGMPAFQRLAVTGVNSDVTSADESADRTSDGGLPQDQRSSSSGRASDKRKAGSAGSTRSSTGASTGDEFSGNGG